MDATGRGDYMSKRGWHIGVLVGILILMVYKICLITSGLVDNLPGDSSVRMILSNYCGNHLYDFMTNTIWQIHWPPGQFILLGVLFKILKLFPVSIHYVTIGLIVSVMFFSIAQYLMFLIGSEVDGPVAGFFSFLIFSGAVQLNGLSLCTMAEIYAIPFILAALLCFILYQRQKTGILECSFFLLLAALFRSEAVLVAGVFSLILLLQKRIAHSLVLLFISTGFTISKISIGIFSDTIQYLNASEFRDFPSGQEALTLIYTRFLPAFIREYNAYVWIVGLCFLIYLLFKRRSNIYVQVFFGYGICILLLCLFGKIHVIPRYLYISIVFFILIASQALHKIVQIPSLNRDWTARTTVLTIVCAILLSITIGNIGKVEDSCRHNVSREVIDTRNWLMDHVSKQDYVFFDFLRFRGAYFRSYTDSITLMRPSFDYTTFYTGIPSVERNDLYYLKVSRALENTNNTLKARDLLINEGYTYLMQYRPEYIVVAGSKLYSSLSKTQYYPIMIKPYIEQSEENNMYYFILPTDTKTRYNIEMVFINSSFEIYRVID